MCLGVRRGLLRECSWDEGRAIAVWLRRHVNAIPSSRDGAATNASRKDLRLLLTQDLDLLEEDELRQRREEQVQKILAEIIKSWLTNTRASIRKNASNTARSDRPERQRVACFPTSLRASTAESSGGHGGRRGWSGDGRPGSGGGGGTWRR